MNINKIISLITLSCFLFCFVFDEALFASLDIGRTQQSAANNEDSAIPQSCGRVTDYELFDSKQIVVNIQDLHCHPEVQRNIAGILSALDLKYGLKNVYVEGGYGNVDTSWICNVKDRAAKKQIIEGLVDQGRLTGSEYYSALSNRPELLKGLEDEAIHKANIVRLGKILEKKPEFDQQIKELGKELEFMKSRYFSPRNRVFSRLVEQHRSGRIDTLKYYLLLGKYAKTINEDHLKANNASRINIDEYPNIRAYIQLGRTGKQLDYDKVARQLRELVQILKSRIPYSMYSALLEKTDNFSKTEELYRFLSQLSSDYKLNLEVNFPDLKRFLDYTQLSAKLNPISLIQEEKNLTNKIQIGLSRDIGELEVSFLADFFCYYRDYLQNNISADDYRYFKQSSAKFYSLWKTYSINNRIEELSKDYGLLNDFYECNCKRNDCFVRNITLEDTSPDKTDRNMEIRPLAEQLKNLQIVAVVTGGFHTEELKRVLREKRISYVTITPNITSSVDKSGIRYAELVKYQARLFGSQALALALGSMGAKIIDIDNDKIIIEMNGERIEIQPNKKKEFNVSAALEKIKGQIKATFDPGALNIVPEESAKIVEAMKDFANPLASTELIYQLLKAFARYGAQKDLFGSNGIIFGIASSRGVQEAVENFEHVTAQDLESFPEVLQQITANKALARENLSKTPKTPILAAIKAALVSPEISLKLEKLIEPGIEAIIAVNTAADDIALQDSGSPDISNNDIVGLANGNDSKSIAAPDVYGGGEFNPQDPLVKEGSIMPVSSYENINGLGLVAYARKMRAEKGITRLYFDFDLTLFRPMGYVSSPQWLRHVDKEYGFDTAIGWFGWGRSPHENRQMSNGFFFRLMDENLPRMLEELKNDGFELIGITARNQSRDEQRTKDILDKFGFSFEKIIFTAGAQNKAAKQDVRPQALLLIALSETGDLLAEDKRKLIVDTVDKRLLTPYGLRSLAPENENYYGGDKLVSAAKGQNNSDYQGSVWPYYLSYYFHAKMNVAMGKDSNTYRSVKDDLKRQINNLLFVAKEGLLPEVFSGNAPYYPGGRSGASLYSISALVECMSILQDDVLSKRGKTAHKDNMTVGTIMSMFTSG